MQPNFLFLGWVGHLYAPVVPFAAALEAASTNQTDDITVMLTVKSFTRELVNRTTRDRLEHKIDEATSEVRDRVTTIVSKNREDVIDLLQQDIPAMEHAPNNQDIHGSNLMSQGLNPDKVTYTDFGKGYCRPRTNYYGQYGLTSGGCQSQCDLDVACQAYNFRAVDGGCGIWAPDASKAPSGWSFYAGESATIINHTNGNALAYCMRKRTLNTLNTLNTLIVANSSQSRLLSIGNAGSTTSSRGLSVGIGIGGAVILLCCLFFCLRHSAIFYKGNKQEGMYADAPVEVWEKIPTDKKEYLAMMILQLDELEQSDESPEGYISKNDLGILRRDHVLRSKLSWLGFTIDDCENAFETVYSRTHNKKGFVPGCVPLDDFLDECVKVSGSDGDTLKKTSSFVLHSSRSQESMDF
jgi:hypothetical protein